MMNLIYDKTDKGREEIATRKYHLSAKLRGVLLLIDGKRSGDELEEKFAGAGFTPVTLQELLDGGYVEALAAPVSEAVPELQAAPSAPAAESPPASPGGDSQYQAIYHFYSETIKNTLGLRGYPMQLKVERCASVDDFRALRTPYLEAVFRSKGEEMARSLRDRLDQLLFQGEAIPADLQNVDF